MNLLLTILGFDTGMLAFMALSAGLAFYWIRNARYRGRKILHFDVRPCSENGRSDHAGHQSLIIFYNQGMEVVRYDDFASEGPLQVISDKKLLNAELIGHSDPYAQVAFNETSAGFSISPEYLDRGDAFVLRVDHENDASLNVEGRLPGGGIYRARGLTGWYLVNFVIHIVTRLLILAGFIGICRWLPAYFGIGDWILLPLCFLAGILAIYLVATFDYDIRRVHRLARAHFR